MPTPSTRLGLLVPSTADQFDTDDIANNWETLDDAPGVFICNSTTRPVWGAGQAGRLIFETDTDLLWRWHNPSSSWRRITASGLLVKSGGTVAVGERTTDFSTAAQANFQKVVSVTSVVVPDGNRPLRVEVVWQRANNAASNTNAAIIRSDANNGTPILAQWQLAQAPAGEAGGGSYAVVLSGGLAPGQYDFSFQIKVGDGGGTSTVTATAQTPTQIIVTEL